MPLKSTEGPRSPISVKRVAERVNSSSLSTSDLERIWLQVKTVSPSVSVHSWKGTIPPLGRVSWS